MTCSSCEERRKLLAEATDAAKRGDLKLAQEKISAAVMSFTKPVPIIAQGFLGAIKNKQGQNK